MSGNLWMFSDKLDDEDIEILKHEFITYYQGADYYGLGLKMFTRLAHEAGAVYKIGKKVLIRRTIFDEYLRKLYRKPTEDVNDLLIKVIDAPKKKRFGRTSHEAR